MIDTVAEQAGISVVKPLQIKETTGLKENNALSVGQLINLCIGIIGIQFAWSVQISLSARVLEGLGADPFLYGLIWCAGPITGIFVQPIVGALSDKTSTRFGRRRPYMLIGAVLACISLLAFPYSGLLLTAALLIWIIDASVNISQGPYRALIPDLTPKKQHSVGNGYLSFAFGVGSVIAFGAAPLVQFLSGFEMTVSQQYSMAAIAVLGLVLYTCMTIKEIPPRDEVINTKNGETLFEGYKKFLKLPKDVYMLCAVQFFTWLGLMCIFLYFAPYMLHNIYLVPDLSQVSAAVKNSYEPLAAQASMSTGIAFALFNFVCLLIAIPQGYLCNKFGMKNVYTAALMMLVLASLAAPFLSTTEQVYAMMAVAGIAWGGILSIPFAMLCSYIPEGEEGSLIGIFNMFIASPQLISAILIGWCISQMTYTLPDGELTHYWTFGFLVTGVSVIIAIILLQFIKIDEGHLISKAK